MSPIEALILSAFSYIGTPYHWGGKHPSQGLDCSGLVQLILRGAGIDPPGDQNAQQYYDLLEPYSVVGGGAWGPGALAFFGESVTKIKHVAFCINQYQMIEARGGDSTCLTVEDAIKKGASVQLTLIAHRKDLVAMLKPDYTKLGMMR